MNFRGGTALPPRSLDIGVGENFEIRQPIFFKAVQKTLKVLGHPPRSRIKPMLGLDEEGDDETDGFHNQGQ